MQQKARTGSGRNGSGGGICRAMWGIRNRRGILRRHIIIRTRPAKAAVRCAPRVIRIFDIKTPPGGIFTFNLNIFTRPLEIVTRPLEIFTCKFVMLTGKFVIVTRPLEVVTRPLEIVTRPLEVVTRPLEIVTNDFEGFFPHFYCICLHLDCLNDCV